ncbi:PucR family transcriptional regulator [Streptomyces broussonetiae]|uniref:PucR family transcriptional regulator n=1 Tax=Streptomyces broussonetiae TaxID=2686304 RepID=UPI0018EF2C62|nr:PucR family transcriptional regulator [Streptomyces broussonetiae]
MSWEPPSPRVCELIRQGARRALDPPQDWLRELDEATLSGPQRVHISEDPVLAAATRRANRSNLLFWASANIDRPGARVPPNVGDVPVAVARDLVRRGLNESALDAYRAGQGVAIRRWIGICLSLTADVDELRELLDVSCRSITTFVDDTIAAVTELIARQRDELAQGTHAERRETVGLLLYGAPIPPARAEQRLGYRLTGRHTAAIVWSEEAHADPAALARVTDLVAASAADPQPLTVLAADATRWMWLHGHPDRVSLRDELAAEPSVRVAVGSSGEDLAGFRRSHIDALTAQRMLARLASPQQLATHDEVELVALATSDVEAADGFVRRVLGELAHAEPEIREAARVFIAAQCNASHAADRLYIHRNTLLRRLAQAGRLLPRPLAEDVVGVGTALEILRWRGAG